eukprot:gene18292-27137_t
MIINVRNLLLLTAVALVGTARSDGAPAVSCWRDLPGMNDVASRANQSSDTKCCKFLGVMAVDTLDACKGAAVAAGGGFAGVTYHTAAFARSSPSNAAYAKHCYGVHTGAWEPPTSQEDIVSSVNTTACSPPPSPPPPVPPGEQEKVFYLGDPQIGFGTAGWRQDEARFAAAATAAHAAGAAAVVIAGDLVNVWDNATLTSGFDAVWPSHFDASKVHLVPGNHDVNSEADTPSEFAQQLAHYRFAFGSDYSSFETRFATFVLINSESLIVPELGLNGTTDPCVLNETATQWSWLEKTLAAGVSAGKHLIVVSHHPAFLEAPTEPHQYWNWPLNARHRLLDLLQKNGVKKMLCGHTHTTTNRTVAGLSIYTVAGTARAFDNNGCGYSVLTISADEVGYEYIRHDSGPGLTAC